MKTVEQLAIDYQPTRLELELGLDYERWLEVLSALGAIARGHQWWIGDALVYGEDAYGDEKAFQGAEELSLEPATLTNYRWVAAAVTASRRRESLSWSHHAEVARLKPREQTSMLRLAEQEHWTVRELRDQVAQRYPQDDVQPRIFDDPPSDELVQRRLEEIARRLELGFENVTAEDVAWLLTLARQLSRHP